MKKRSLSICLLLALLLSLAACGGKQESVQPSAAVPGGERTEEPRYEASYIRLCQGLNGSVTPLTYTDEGLYALVYESTGPRTLGEGVTEAYEGQYDVYENRLYFIGYDGGMDLLEDYAPAWKPEKAGDQADFTSYHSLNGLAVNGAGELLALETDTASWYEGPAGLSREEEAYWQNYETENRFFLRRLDRNGGELSRAELALDGCQFINSGLVPDGEGNLLFTCCLATGETCAVALAEDGGEAYRLKTGEYLAGAVRLGDGRPAVLGSLATGWGMRIVNAKEKSFGESCSLPDEVMELIGGDEKYDFYYSGGSQLYGYDLETGEARPVLTWLDCDVNGGYLSGVTLRPDGTILAVENAQAGEENRASLITLAKTAAPPAEKRTLTLAALDLDPAARSAVIDFNRRSQDTRVEVIDYSQYNDDPGDRAGLTRLTTELLTGNAPDILALDGLPYDQLAAKGLLEDLYPWLDADSELSREAFFPSVLSAMEVSGGLYQVCPYFSIETVIGARSVVGDRMGWTYEELYAALETLPEGSTVFDPGTTSSNALYGCLPVNLDSLMDWGAGTCRFDSEDFLALLDFAGRFPAEYREDEGSGVQLLQKLRFSSLMDLPLMGGAFGGADEIAYIGYPTIDGGCGSAIVLDAGFAMSASCGDKEAAWELLRTFMTGEYQTDTYRLPTNRDRFEKSLDRITAPSWVLDSEGNYLLDENGERVQKAMFSFNGMDVYPPSREQAGRVLDLAESCERTVRQETDTVLGIVLENAGDFLAGKMSAQEAARQIQSRVSLYMNEQS